MEIIYPTSNKKSIHPLGIFKEGLGIWRENFICLSGIYLIFYAPSIILQILLQFLSNAATLALKAVSLVVILSNFLFSIAGIIVLFVAVNTAKNGATCRIIESVTLSKKYFLHYLGVFLLSSGFLIFLIALTEIIGFAIIYLGVLFLKINRILSVITMIIAAAVCLSGIVYLVYFAIRFSLSGLAVIVEDKKPVSALKRSYNLIKKYVNPVIGEYFLFGILSILLVAIPQTLLGIAMKDTKQLNSWVLAYQYLAGLVITPLWCSVVVVLYRRLKEAVE